MAAGRGILRATFLVLATGLLAAGCTSGRNDVAGSIATAPPEEARPAPQGDGGADAATGGALAAALDVAVPIAGPRIVKTATLGLEVDSRAFDSRLQDVATVAGTHAGFVASSRQTGDGTRSAGLVLRIPSGSFEAALADLRALGTVTSQEVSGQDVTAQFVDLEARLRNWEAQERVLLDLMAKSSSIEDSIQVQRHLQDVQLTIERLRGQLRVLSDQTEFSAITVNLAVAGEAPADETSLAAALGRARDGFVAVIAAAVVAVGYLLPIALLAAAGAGVWIGLSRRARTRSAPAP